MDETIHANPKRQRGNRCSPRLRFGLLSNSIASGTDWHTLCYNPNIDLSEQPARVTILPAGTEKSCRVGAGRCEEVIATGGKARFPSEQGKRGATERQKTDESRGARKGKAVAIVNTPAVKYGLIGVGALVALVVVRKILK